MTDVYDDYCYECTAYGDDYFENEDGQLEWKCPSCPFNNVYDEGE